MKTTLDDQLDEFEEENKFLEMDPNAEMVSFTSINNPAPHSLQIILRTEEIRIDEDKSEIVDMETQETPSNPFERMWNVLMDIWKAIVEVFNNR